MDSNAQIVTEEIAEALGITRAALDEIVGIVGRMPTEDELSTLLAMWEANGKQQSLYGWLKGQHHLVEKQEYLYTGEGTEHHRIREPKIKECVALAKETMLSLQSADTSPIYVSNSGENWQSSNYPSSNTSLKLLYLVGRISTDFLNSEYAQRCLHIAHDRINLSFSQEEHDYTEMILQAMESNHIIGLRRPINRGGLFSALVELCHSIHTGFDILTCREVRLDAFLFGEEAGRWVAAIEERHDDLFLQKLDEARIDACFLGRLTKGRILVDGYDFGSMSDYKDCQKV